MKNNPSAEQASAGNGWTRFWFTPTPITGMKVLRVLSGLLFCFWLLSFLGHQAEFFSLNGWFDEAAYKETLRRQRLAERPPVAGVDLPQPSIAPAPIGWSMVYLAGDSDQAFQILYWASIVVLVLFTLGIGTRITGVLAWIVVVSFLANPATSYEADYLLGILAFYLMLGHLFTGVWNGNRSFLGLVFGPCDQMIFARAGGELRVSIAANFMMRLLQIHVAIIILTSGVAQAADCRLVGRCRAVVSAASAVSDDGGGIERRGGECIDHLVFLEPYGLRGARLAAWLPLLRLAERPGVARVAAGGRGNRLGWLAVSFQAPAVWAVRLHRLPELSAARGMGRAYDGRLGAEEG